jgi:hypothetical protein
MPLPFDMGDNPYTSLANIQRPEMMGNAPVGGGASAGLQYAQQLQRQNATMDQASQFAQLQAIMKAKQADEYSAGAPGRMADIQVGNAEAQNKQANLPSILGAQSNAFATNLSESKRKKMEAAMDELSPYANSYVNAKDEDTKQAVIDMMKSDGYTKIGNKSIDEIPPATLDKFMQMTRQRAVNSVGQQQKTELETQKEKGAIERVDAIKKADAERFAAQSASKERVAQTYAAARTKAAEISAKSKEDKQKFEDEYWKKRATNNTTPEEDQTMIELMSMKNYVASGKAANGPPTIDTSKMPDLPLKQPTAPQPPPLPNRNSNIPNGKAPIPEAAARSMIKGETDPTKKADLKAKFKQIYQKDYTD